MQQKWLKWLAVPLCIIAGIGADQFLGSKPPPSTQQEEHHTSANASNAPSGGVSRSPKRKPVTGQIVVKNAYITQSEKWLLGDREDYTDPACLTVVVDTKKVKALPVADPNELIGATVNYSGFESFYRGKKQHQATKLSVKGG
jgi:hypothetical protein